MRIAVPESLLVTSASRPRIVCSFAPVRIIVYFGAVLCVTFRKTSKGRCDVHVKILAIVETSANSPGIRWSNGISSATRASRYSNKHVWRFKHFTRFYFVLLFVQAHSSFCTSASTDATLAAAAVVIVVHDSLQQRNNGLSENINKSDKN